MNQPATQQQGTEADQKKVGYNETLSQKGRASVAASTVLILSSLGFVHLTQLPFIGSALKPSEGIPLALMLSFAAFYYWYRFSSYKRVTELDSMAEELSQKYMRLYLQLKVNRIIAKAHRHILRHGSLGGFDIYLRSPAYDANQRDSGRFWSPFHLKFWAACPGQFGGFTWPIPLTWGLLGYMPNESWPLDFQSEYRFADSEGYECIFVMDHSIHMSMKKWRRMKIICQLLASVRLPDFLEKTFPTILLIVALALALPTLFDSPPIKPKTTCEEAASTMIKACS
ncbi:hypothetical protein [Shewanella zhangzhouensis]|uniref:hypothetical protein n=1 Tax=Shewanella zhangzhouensis TaxID=2864213 RepID=UPI001C6558FA|nr:hypothetical protein [Shewanella zhangzhouensis]QYK07248.1 hypothetical protein K0H63_17995 [Shewanella zhangzhouensis]